MFFWGSYNFQVTQQTEHPSRPPLRYPVYIPPTPSLVQAALCTATATATITSDETETAPPQTVASTSVDKDAVLSFVQQSEVAQGHGRSGSSSGLADEQTVSTLVALSEHRLAVRMAACGSKHMVALVSGEPLGDGQAGKTCLLGLGSNHSGQLGSAVATYTNTLTDLRVGDVLEGRIVSIACGAKHTLLATETGCVYVCGDNSFGQLGLPAPLGTRTQAGLNGGAPCCAQFAQLTSLAHISKVFANQNASFALDQRGKVYSWGDAQYGHLCHDSRGEALDSDTLKIVTVNVRSPQLVQAFQQQHIRIVDIAVGKSHVVCCSEDDVYTCGDGAYGKLGTGSATPSLQPVKVVFPERKQTEKLVSIAAGDDHTLVLKVNPVIGSVVYFFGKLSNADGQLRPAIVTVPGAHSITLTRVFAGKGTQCACLAETGQLFVWGKHSYPKVYNGTNASAPRATPSRVEVLEGFPLTGMAAGGCFCVAFAGAAGARVCAEPEPHADTKALDEEAAQSKMGMKAEDPNSDAEVQNTVASLMHRRLHAWDVVVPQDARVSTHNPDGDVEEEYECGRAAFLNLYLGDQLGAAYTATLPPTPPKTAAVRFAYTKRGGRGLSVGSKVRLWMSDVYALATVTRVGPAPPKPDAWLSQSDTPPPSRAASLMPRGSQNSPTPTPAARAASTVKAEAEETEADVVVRGSHVRLEWQRDDWDDESLSLFSDDETVDEENENRWQPFWFESGPDGNYTVARPHK